MTTRRRWAQGLKKLIPCGYCFERWADCYDHIVPFSRGGSNKRYNLYPACRRCNGLVSNLLFSSLDQKRDYVRRSLIARGEWSDASQMQKMRQELSSKESMAKVLLGQVPVGDVGKKSSTGRCKWCGQTKKLMDGTYCKECMEPA